MTVGAEELHKIDKSLKYNYNTLADRIIKEHRLIYSSGLFYEYQNGVYVEISDDKICTYIKTIVGDKFSTRVKSETTASLKASIYIDMKLLNAGEYLNLKNGIYNIETDTLMPHTPDIYSTIQIPVSYTKGAMCDKWLKTLDEILEGSAAKVALLQEFFGLCLTKETKYCKALFLIGEGRNGKSTVLYILENIIGNENKSSIPLEALNNYHYVANLFGKLVNVSIETNSKSEVYDATFKAIVSGDSLTADPKYRNPFTFRPYCKLIYALNNMPRVNDKTDAYFRRLLILRFNKQFEGSDDNKALKQELLSELDGIFMWCVAGYRRLKERGDFTIDNKIQAEVDEHRKENNNVIGFVEEECELTLDYTISKDDLYQEYRKWCQDNNHHASTKIKFGKELTRRYKLSDELSGNEFTRHRIWVGIGIRLQKGRYERPEQDEHKF